MKISINSRNEIIGYAETGSVSGAIEADVVIPDDYEPKKYKLIDGAVVDNADYVPTNHTAINRVVELKTLLRKYDYIGVKIAQGRATISEYAAKIAEAQALADEVNALESQMTDIDKSLCDV